MEFDFHSLMDQPLIMGDHLDPERIAMESMPKDDIVGQGSLQWKLAHRFIHATQKRFPHFHVVRHDSLSIDPIGGFRQPYGSFGLGFTEKVEKIILSSSSSKNPASHSMNMAHSFKLDSRANLKNWKKQLSKEEIRRIRNLTLGISELFYTEDEWR